MDVTFQFPTLGVWTWVAWNWAALAIALTLLSLVVYLALLFGKYLRICLNLFVDTRPPMMMGAVDFQRLKGEEVRFRSFDGTSLRGMHIPTLNRQVYRGTIIFCHEFGSDMHTCGRYARPLIDAGFDVFAFDFRGHGESSSSPKYRPLQWPSDKELEDVLGACAYVESALTSEGKDTEIGIFGISRGAGASLLAAASDPNIKAIVCDGAFSTESTIITLIKKWAHIFARVKLVYAYHPDSVWRIVVWMLMRFAQPKLGCRFLSVDKALKEMQPRPILFIHGERDNYISVDQTRLLYEKAPSPKYLWMVSEAGHNQSVSIEPKQYAARTIAFFRCYLAGEAVDESEIISPAGTEVA